MVDITITLEHRFKRTPDGKVWTQTMFANSFWQRYLAVFDHVYVAARVEEIEELPADWMRADGNGVSFLSIPYYLGLKQYLAKSHDITSAARQIVATSQAFILRTPSHIAAHFWPILHATGHPYGVEAVGDAYDCYAPGAVRHPLRPLIRRVFLRQMRQQCWHANAVSYVSLRALQPRFPTAPEHFSIGCSDIELDETWFVDEARLITGPQLPATLVTVGSLGQMVKAIDILLTAVSICLRRGVNIHLNLIGDGKHRQSLELLARQLGIENAVTFFGQLPSGASIRHQLDAADLFILPSRTEGLPRALIEAMARALPCIGSAVGGITELLSPVDCIHPGNPEKLASKIIEVLHDGKRMAAMSHRNLEHAKDYLNDKLIGKRLAFLRMLSDRTEQWLMTH
ncbi:MAG TPA: glycosyltransferase [Armatimonadota bacterium]|nr:glycosyltransferase [Armatimonadota bacterium]